MNRLLTIVDSKYQRLEYLESDGNQWINTGLSINLNDTVEFEVFVEELSQTGANVFYNAGDDTGNRKGCFLYNWGNYSSLYCNYIQDSNNTQYTFPYSQKVKIKNILESDNYNCYADGLLRKSYSATDNVISSGLTLFSGTSGHNKIVMKLYSFVVKNYQTQNITHNFVPVLRKSDNELGMVDLVEGKFYTNAGTGKFTANLDTMYAIIQGSPTQSPYGVFSGFSTSNYLITQQYLKPQNDSWEIKLVVTTGNDITTVQGIASPLNTSSVLFWCFDGRITIQLYDATYYFLGNGFNVQVNTKYYLKATYIATEQRYIIAYSTDNTNYTIILNSVSDKIINQPDQYYNFGTARGQDRPFSGSIDLNHSYIKIDDTKYKIVAVAE